MPGPTIYTPDTAPSYATYTDVMYDCGRVSLTTAEQTKAAAILATASRWVDQQTSRWFYVRNLKVTTAASGDAQVRLFMPAPILTLASVVEDALTLDLDTVLTYPSALEKLNNNVPGDWWGRAMGQYWSQRQQAVVVTATMGYATIPSDIVKLTAHVAAALLGWNTKEYVRSDGISGSVVNTDVLPDWGKMTLANWSRTTMHGQDLILEDAS